MSKNERKEFSQEQLRRELRRWVSPRVSEEILSKLFPKRKAISMAERHRRAKRREAERREADEAEGKTK